jgi:hypothetical protein
MRLACITKPSQEFDSKRRIWNFGKRPAKPDLIYGRRRKAALTGEFWRVKEFSGGIDCLNKPVL